MKCILLSSVAFILLFSIHLIYADEPVEKMPANNSYTIVDTGQIRCYDSRTEIRCPGKGEACFGQDGQYEGNQPSYKDNGDGTVTDLNTGLMWTQNPGPKKTYGQCVSGASACRTGGFSDWRLPTIKELYSLILFSGTDPDIRNTESSGLVPFIDTRYFKFNYGRAEESDRIIDSQYAASTLYRGQTMGGGKTMFGVNFADGRIKGYPIGSGGPRGPRGEKKYYVMYVRGNADYGRNDFKDNGDGTITDRATGLMWMKADSGHLKAGARKDGRLDWPQSLEWAEELEHAGYSDWRLPNAKELQSIVDYSRCPDVTGSAAIDPVFETTQIKNEGGSKDYPFFWTGTSHCRLNSSETAVYIAFGRSLGWMQDRGSGRRRLLDVHGAGSQRSDPKTGNPSQFPYGRGPQGDVVRIYNFARCVRGGKSQIRTAADNVDVKPVSQPQNAQLIEQRSLGPGTGADFVKRLDRDGDGKVSRQEFDGMPEHFSRLDRNGDGYLSKDEAPQGPPPGRMRPSPRP